MAKASAGLCSPWSLVRIHAGCFWLLVAWWLSLASPGLQLCHAHLPVSPCQCSPWLSLFSHNLLLTRTQEPTPLLILTNYVCKSPLPSQVTFWAPGPRASSGRSKVQPTTRDTMTRSEKRGDSFPIFRSDTDKYFSCLDGSLKVFRNMW